MTSPRHAEIAARIDAQRGVISRRCLPGAAGALDHLLAQGRLVRVLPGVYATADRASDPVTRMRAVHLWDLDAVLTGRSAAMLTFWPARPPATIDVAAPGRQTRSPGFTVHRRRIPTELVVERAGIRFTAPALTALDLTRADDADAIDAVLRSRLATLTQLHDALAATAGRDGNVARRRLLLDSRDEPWSRPERLTHRLLRADGLHGWIANYPVPIRGHRYYVDVAFPTAMLAIEIDGREHHTGAAAFESDRWRQNDLVNAGWRVLRFTWTMVSDEPQAVLAAIHEALGLPRHGRP